MTNSADYLDNAFKLVNSNVRMATAGCAQSQWPGVGPPV